MNCLRMIEAGSSLLGMFDRLCYGLRIVIAVVMKLVVAVLVVVFSKLCVFVAGILSE